MRTLIRWIFNPWYVTPAGSHRRYRHPNGEWTTHLPSSEYGLANCPMCVA